MKIYKIIKASECLKVLINTLNTFEKGVKARAYSDAAE